MTKKTACVIILFMAVSLMAGVACRTAISNANNGNHTVFEQKGVPEASGMVFINCGH